MHKLRINPLARQDLLDIKDYITNELDSPGAASNVVSKIEVRLIEKLNCINLGHFRHLNS